MRPARLVSTLLVLALLATGASALTAQGGNAQNRDAISRLEAAREARPNNVAALRALGIAYYKAERFQEAHAVLDQARRLDPRDGLSALYSGMSAEKLRDFTAAKAAYNSYLQHGRTRRVRNQISQRLVAMQREELIEAAKAAVANEATVSQTAGDRRTVAVPAFRFSGPDAESLAPLERGMAELIITDLAHSSQLTIVERDRMQALADEIQLADRADPTTAARAGRLMQAGRLISGGIVQTGSQLVLSSSVVDVATSQISDPAQVTNGLDAIFAAEKQLVLRIFEQLGVTLTPAERQAVDRTPTNNLNAFLEFSRGLQASDDGRFDDAARFFDNARTMDPGFGAATARFNAAQAAAQGAAVTSETIEAGLEGTAEGETVESAASGETGDDRVSETLRDASQNVNPATVSSTSDEATDRRSENRNTKNSTPKADPSSDNAGTTSPLARTGTVTLVIRRP